MNYKIDILIVHAGEDNKPVGKNEIGWVSSFKKFLNLLLHQFFGEDLNILLKSEFDSLSAADIKDVAICIPILSSSFIGAENNLIFLQKFIGLVGKNKAKRLFKVLKHPVAENQQPQQLRNLLPFELYHFDHDTLEVTEFNDFFGEEAEDDFWMKMVDLSYEIHASLLLLKSKSGKADVKSIFSRKTVYLSETGHDLIVPRNAIKRELLRYGYRILPDHSLPANPDELKKNIKKDLEEADISIHLIGNSYGEIPQGSDKSIVEIQNQLSVEKNQSSPQFVRIVWLPVDISKAGDRQKAFIENLKRDIDFSGSAGILQTPLEDFKNILRDELLNTGNRRKLHLLSGDELTNGNPAIYVLHDKADEKEVKPYLEYIRKAGYRILIPEFTGDLQDLRQAHINNLQLFDAAVIYQNKVNDQWVRMKLLDLLKAPGFGRNKPIKGRAVISENNTDFIKSYAPQEITVIGGANEDKLDSLKEFLKDLNE